MTARVAIVVKTAVGGIWILPQVRALRAAGAEVTVVIPDGPGRLSDRLSELARADAGVSVLRTDYRFSLIPTPSTIRAFLRFRRALRELDCDSVLYHLYASALSARAALLGTRARRVHMVAGPLHLESPIIRFAERVLHRADDVIICGSAETARRYRSVVGDSQKLVAIPYGVDTTAFAPLDRSSRDAVPGHGLTRDDGRFTAVMVAFVYAPKRLVHRGRGIKGHDILLDAWQSFVAEHPDSRLVIVGGGFGPEGEEYRRQIVSRLRVGLDESRVTWLDTVEDVQGLYGIADVSVSPSLSENHGAALEASAMGVPSIVSDAGGLPETVDTGRTGWIVPAGDPSSLAAALERAHRAWRAGELPEMGAAARDKAVREFDSTDAATAVAHVLLDGVES